MFLLKTQSEIQSKELHYYRHIVCYAHSLTSIVHHCQKFMPIPTDKLWEIITAHLSQSLLHEMPLMNALWPSLPSNYNAREFHRKRRLLDAFIENYTLFELKLFLKLFIHII